MAAYTTARFNKYIREELMTTPEGQVLFFNKDTPYFDARIFQVDNIIECFNAFLFRMKDCVKNSKNGFSQKYISHKKLQGLTSDEAITLVEEETGKKW